MKLGVRESKRYRDVSWLMPSVDVQGVLERLGVERVRRNGDEVEALCPDHKIFKGCESSHPNWTVNVHTGVTFCRTEPRSSNLVWTVARLLECHPREAAAFMLGEEGDFDMSSLLLSSLKGRMAGMRRHGKEDRKPVFGLDDIKRDMDKRFTSEGMYEFFMNPPGKKYPTNITKETVDRYQVFQRSWGFYANRTIIPFILRDKLEGFCAVDLLGEKGWLKQHPLKDEDDYRKVLYPKGFRSGEYLFGFDDCEQCADYVILTEGSREVMKLWQEGFTNSVAILGGNVGDDHIRLISTLSPKAIVLMFDGDEAGYRFTDKAADKLSRLFDIKKCLLPVGRDPKNLDKGELGKFINRLF